MSEDFDNAFRDLADEFIERVTDRLIAKIDGWKAADADRNKFDPAWAAEQLQWFNDGVESVKTMLENMLENMRDENL